MEIRKKIAFVKSQVHFDLQGQASDLKIYYTFQSMSDKLLNDLLLGIYNFYCINGGFSPS